MDNLPALISTLGFPIVMCGALCYYINTTIKQFSQNIRENTELLKQLIIKLEGNTENE